jgi:hypothetical protein
MQLAMGSYGFGMVTVCMAAPHMQATVSSLKSAIEPPKIQGTRPSPFGEVQLKREFVDSNGYPALRYCYICKNTKHNDMLYLPCILG